MVNLRDELAAYNATLCPLPNLFSNSSTTPPNQCAVFFFLFFSRHRDAHGSVLVVSKMPHLSACGHCTGTLARAL